MQNDVATMTRLWKFHRKLNTELPILSGHISKELKSGSWRGISISMFLAALFTVAKEWEQPKCPSTEEWIKKMWHIHTMQHYSALKNSAICNNIDKLWQDYAEWNKPVT